MTSVHTWMGPDETRANASKLWIAVYGLEGALPEMIEVVVTDIDEQDRRLHVSVTSDGDWKYDAMYRAAHTVVHLPSGWNANQCMVCVKNIRVPPKVESASFKLDDDAMYEGVGVTRKTSRVTKEQVVEACKKVWSKEAIARFWGKGIEDRLQDCHEDDEDELEVVEELHIPAPEAKIPCVECSANVLESRLKETPKGLACAYCALRIASQRSL